MSRSPRTLTSASASGPLHLVLMELTTAPIFDWILRDGGGSSRARPGSGTHLSGTFPSHGFSLHGSIGWPPCFCWSSWHGGWTHGRTQREKSGPWEGELVDEEVARQSLEVFGSAWHWGISCNRQAVTKDLTSSSKFSGSCVLTLQTLPSESKVRTRPWTWIPFGFSLVSNAGHPLIDDSKSKAGTGKPKTGNPKENQQVPRTNFFLYFG